MGKEKKSNYAENAIELVETQSPSTSEAVGKVIGEVIAKVIESPEIAHYGYVKEAYEDDKYGVVVILLSAFFESSVTNSLREYFEAVKEKENTEGNTKFFEDMNFEKKIKLARIIGIIDDNEFSIMNKVRVARNNFAHNLDSYAPYKERRIIKETRVKDAWELYKNLLDVDDTLDS